MTKKATSTAKQKQAKTTAKKTAKPKAVKATAKKAVKTTKSTKAKTTTKAAPKTTKKPAAKKTKTVKSTSTNKDNIMIQHLFKLQGLYRTPEGKTLKVVVSEVYNLRCFEIVDGKMVGPMIKIHPTSELAKALVEVN